MRSNIRNSIILGIAFLGVGVALAAEVSGTSVENLSVEMIMSKRAAKVGTAKVDDVETTIYCKASGSGFTCYAEKPNGVRIPTEGAAKIVQRAESFVLSIPFRGGTTVNLSGAAAAKIEHDCCTIIYGDGTPSQTLCPCPSN
jgi:hypothetical protein